MAAPSKWGVPYDVGHVCSPIPTTRESEPEWEWESESESESDLDESLSPVPGLGSCLLVGPALYCSTSTRDATVQKQRL